MCTVAVRTSLREEQKMSDQLSVVNDIDAPPATVWGLVSDLTRMGEWSPENVGGRWVKGATGPAPGARFKGENRNGDKSWATEVKVLDCEPAERFSFLVTVGPMKIAEWAYDFEEIEGGCRVTETWTDRRGWLAKKASGPASGVKDRREHNRHGMEQTLARLAAVAES
jgi:uncharacterized protein YndB with AHSA1/START domain